MEVRETKKQRKQNMKEDEWRGTKKEDGETKKQRKWTCRQRNKGDKPFDIKSDKNGSFLK